jgi:hypothetical protein
MNLNRDKERRVKFCVVVGGESACNNTKSLLSRIQVNKYPQAAAFEENPGILDLIEAL